jgi:hypothetical protein
MFYGTELLVLIRFNDFCQPAIKYVLSWKRRHGYHIRVLNYGPLYGGLLTEGYADV